MNGVDSFQRQWTWLMARASVGISSAHAQMSNDNKTDRVVEALEWQISEFLEATKTIKTLAEQLPLLQKSESSET
jgi:hypothetical protein